LRVGKGGLKLATKRKLILPNLPFRPLALKCAGEWPLMMDLPKQDQRSMLRNARLNNSCGGVITIVDLADRLSTDHHSISRWFKHGVRWHIGEDLCDRIHVHPVEVWPDYYRLLADAELEFELGMQVDDLVDDKIMEKIGGQ
jgi:hypothetical protein